MYPARVVWSPALPLTLVGRRVGVDTDVAGQWWWQPVGLSSLVPGLLDYAVVDAGLGIG